MEGNPDGDDEQFVSESDDSEGGGGGGAADRPEDWQTAVNNQESGSDDDEEQPFDITLPATHSYMGSDLVAVSGHEVLEAGWRGRVPVVAHHGAVFPGETVPLLLSPRTAGSAALAAVIRDERMFGLLAPDESGWLSSGYGVLCEVYEAGDSGWCTLTVKARANRRFRLVDAPKRPMPLHHFTGLPAREVEVLPEDGETAPLRHTRLQSLDHYRRPHLPGELRRLEAAVTPWPAFVYDTFDYARIRQTIKDFFFTLHMDKVPNDPVALSFWVASNLPLAPRDRLALLMADTALERLHRALHYIRRRCTLSCSSCLTEVTRRDHIFAMSSDGVHSNYTNLGGSMHDVVTVSHAENVLLDGAPSAEYSWFPGYTWTIALCRTCAAHVGWRFDAMKPKLRPQQFFGLCRNQVQPSPAGEDARPPSL